MSSIPMVAPQRRISHSTMAGIVAVAFALGTLTGFGVPRILGGVGPATAAIGAAAISGVAVHDMSGAAYEALHPSTVAALGAPVTKGDMSSAAYDALHGLAGGAMSDAAYQALHPSTLPTLAPFIVTNDMSAAAYDAIHGPAEQTMSDAAYDALHAPPAVR